jgi:integrase
MHLSPAALDAAIRLLDGPELVEESWRRRPVPVLRHTFCSHLAMRGAPARAIQELAGHRDLATTQRYMHLSGATLDSAIRLLESRPPAVAGGDIVETGSVVGEKSFS